MGKKKVSARENQGGKVTQIVTSKKISDKQSNGFFSRVLHKGSKPKSEYRKAEEFELRDIESQISALSAEKDQKKTVKAVIPAWFYIASIFAAFLFTAYISIFAALHFEDIGFMNITIVFFFISMVSYFLISALFFISEKKRWHALSPILFFAGIVSLMVYAFKAIDTSDLVRYSIIYTIIVAGISVYILSIRR